MNRTLLLGTLLALSSTHCGSTASSTTTQDTDGDAGDTIAQGAPDGGGADACTAMGTTDDPDDNGIDANCDGADGILGVDVYVSAASGLDTNVGTPTAPLGTLAAAITLATSRHGRVLVAGGSYAGTGLSTAGTWAVFGGYAPSYLGPPARASTTVTGDETGVLIAGAVTASLAHLTIQGGAATSAMSPASHALRVNAQSVTLDDVALVAGNGFAMNAGTSPPANTAAASSCPTAPASPWPQAANGVWGPPGVAPMAGKAGEPGAPGKSASGTLTIASGLALVASDADTGGSDATIGGEGGNGAGGEVTTYMGAPAPYLVLWGGGGGKGGCPGLPGGPGSSGGASVALLALGGTVNVTRSSIQTGLGGTGGDGGTGGAGGGSPGSPPSVEQGSVPGLVIGPTCTPASDEFSESCAEYGAPGGAGGTGGHGGAGAGGWTVGVLSAPGATVSVDAATTFALGRAGSGGSAGDGGSAPSGRQESRYTVGP